jgi:hypothetical protein
MSGGTTRQGAVVGLGTAAPTGTTAPATQAPGPDAPKFDLPSGPTADFQGFKNGDANTQAVLTDATYAATVTAILELQGKTYTTETPNFKRFWSGAKGTGYADTIISEGRDGNVITGAHRYYKPVVKSLQGGNVSVQYCEDQRKGYLKDPGRARSS